MAGLAVGDNGTVKKNPTYGGVKKSRTKRAPSRLISDYVEPLRRLRSIGINLYPELALDRIKSVNDLTEKQRKGITRYYSNYDYLFSRPHVIADFSLPETRVRNEFQTWKREVAAALKKDGFSQAEIEHAIREAGGFEEYSRQLHKQNDQRKLAAQEFAGHHIPDKNLSAAVIPVVTGEPNKVRLKFAKDGTPYVQEGEVKMFNVKLDPLALARGKRKYLEKVLSKYGEKDRFMLVTGDYMTLANSGYKENVIKKMLRYMEKYNAKVIKGKDNPHYWKNWMLSLRVMVGNPYHTEALRSAHDVLRRRMKAEKARVHREQAALKQDHERKQGRVRQQRKRAKDLK